MKDASQFIRNPLGLIGLFIVLIYGFGALVAGASPELTTDQRWVLVWFVVLFPPIVLSALYRLVTRHHSKLYAPADWKDERLLYGPQTLEQITQRETREAVALEEEPVQVEIPPQDAARIPPGVAVAPAPRLQSISMVREAETLVLKELEKELAMQIVTNVRTGLGTRDEVAIDAATLDVDGGSLETLIDIRVTKNVSTLSRNMHRIVDDLRSITSRLNRVGNYHPVMLAVVLLEAPTSQSDDAIERLRQRLSSTSVELRTYSMEALRQRWGA